MSSKVTIVGADGQPFKPARAQMLAGGGMTPYDAADMVGAQMAAWRPYLASPDNELNLYRDRIVRRAVDARWRLWADDPGRYCDAQRRGRMSQLMRLAFRHKLVDGDALALLL